MSVSTTSESEWRSIEQVENGSPSTSPPYYDSDDYDDDGPKPSELFGEHTWKIENFPSIKTRELRGDVFDVGGYKWYILIYPKGCDVFNHLSLFLCVANHEKLLPGWSHLAQFSISVVNNDPKKSKHSDTMHRFWKKEHDWGWKKFLELSKMKENGFIIDEENLVIKARVQVIRERTDVPFRCLDFLYRREMVHMYLSNIEQVCRNFFDEKRSKIIALIEDKPQWSSFRAFWIGIDRVTRRKISKERSDLILKLAVKQFFIEKEHTSTLVVDSLCTGFKALEWQSKSEKGRPMKGKLTGLGFDKMPNPLVYIDDDLFVLSDDLIILLERVVTEPFLYKDDKTVQNGKKDALSSEDSQKDSIESDEWRLTELGRKTMDIFVLSHIFRKIELSYLEAIAWRKQEELIREEELIASSSNDFRGKNNNNNKDKRSSKKKQAKQKRNSRKENKGKGKDFTLDGKIVDNSNESDSIYSKKLEDFSDLSDNHNNNNKVINNDSQTRPESLQPDSIEINETTPNENSNFSNNNSNSRRRLSRRGNNNKRNNNTNNISSTNNNDNDNNKDLVINESSGTSGMSGDTPTHSGRYYYSGIYKRTSESENIVVNLKDRIKLLQQRLVEVEDSLLKQFNAKELSEVFAKTETTTGTESSSSSSPMKNPNRPSNPEITKQTLEITKQTLENAKQTLENTEQSLESTKQTLENTKQTLENSSGTTLKSHETAKPAKKDAVPVPVPTNLKSENQKQKQKQIPKEKSTHNSINTGTSTSTATNTSTGTSTGTKQAKTKPSLVFSISQPSPPVLTTISNPPVILSQSQVTVPSNSSHVLRFGTFNVETLNNPNIADMSPQETTQELQKVNQVANEQEIASSKVVQEEFPFLDIINELLDEDQQSSGYNQSFFSHQYSPADVSPSWGYQTESYYEGFNRVYGSFNMPQVGMSPYLQNQSSYISNVPAVSTGSLNGLSPYRLGDDYYYTNLANAGIHDGYDMYYHGANGNLGPLQS